MKLYPYYFFDKILNSEQIKEVNKIIEKNHHGNEVEDSGAKDKTGEYKKSSTVKLIKYEFLKDILEPVIEGFIRTNTNEYGYELFPLTIKDIFNYNIYSSENNSKYDWHIDIARRQISDIKLTILINLSDNFTGGEFWLNPGNKVMAKELSNPGSAIIFKSDIIHSVTPIKSGTRKTLAIFLEGPNWK